MSADLPALVGVTHLRAKDSTARRRLLGDGVNQRSCQLWRGKIACGRLVCSINRTEDVRQPLPLQRRDIMEIREVEKLQFRFEIALDLIARVGLEPIPLVDCNDQGAPRLDDKPRNVRVLIRNILFCIKHKDNDVGIFDRLQRLDDREFLDRLEDLALAPQTSRVNQGVFLPASFEIDVDRVTRGTRLVKRDHSLFAEQRVDHRALANVRSPNDCDAKNIAFALILGWLGVILQHILDQTPNAFAMSRGNRRRFAQTQFVEVRDNHAVAHTFRLVDGDKDRPFRFAQLIGDLLVERSNAGSAIDHKDDRIGLGNRLFRLARHLLHDPFLGQGLETARVDDQIRLAPHLSVAVVAITRQARNISDQGITCLGQAIEKRRLADVRPAHNDDGWFHSASMA